MNDQTNSVVGAAASTAAATATKFTYGYVVGGSLIGVIGKIDWAVVFSILIGIATFLTNLYFKKEMISVRMRFTSYKRSNMS